MEQRRIIERLIKKFNELDQLPINEDYITNASKLTGLHPKVLKDLDSDDVFEFKVEPVDRSVIYQRLVYFYTTRNKIPNTYELFNSLHGLLPPYIDIGNFRKILVKMDFLWKKVSQATALVIEKPEVRFERYNYLKKIQFHRSTNMDIYYLDMRSYDSNGNFRDVKLTKEVVLDVLQKDWVQKVIYALGPDGIHALEDIQDFSCDVVEEWVRDSLIPRINRPSVFIINPNEYFSRKLLETPTLDSLKSEMKLWLDRHRVPYDDKISKYELYALAEKYTDLNKEFYKIDEMLKCGGHSVARIPKCIANVASIELLARVIDKSFSHLVKTHEMKTAEDPVSVIKSSFVELLVSAGAAYIEEFEKNVSSKEIELIQMEDSVDQAYDVLMSKAGASKTKDLVEDSDLPSCSDTE